MQQERNKIIATEIPDLRYGSPRSLQDSVSPPMDKIDSD